MASRSHYSTCNESRAYFEHQDSQTMLLRDNSINSNVDDDDSVFLEETTSAALSVRSGSDQGESSASSFCPTSIPSGTAVVFPRRKSSEECRRPSVPSGRRLSLQGRPLPSIPTPYSNIDLHGRVKNTATRSASVPNESPQFGSSARDGQPPLPLDQSPPKVSKRCARVQLCLAIVVCLLSACASALSVYTYLMSCRHSQEYCLPCSDLTPPPRNGSFVDYQLTTKREGDQDVCCINSRDELAVLVAQVQRNEKMNYAASQNMTSAHVGLYADNKDRGARSFNEGSHYTLLLSSDPSLQHFQHVTVRSDHLLLQITGRYFVYSSIHFNLSEYHTACSELVYKTWVHHVYVRRGLTQDLNTALLRSEHTCCEECKKERTSGFTGGVFELHAGDEIFVDVSAPAIVIDTKQTSYVGLFLIDKD